MPLNVRKPKHTRRIQLQDVIDFTGGLNLKDDQFRLAYNESPDLWNVDVDKAGGFQLRRVVRPFHENDLGDTPCTIWSFEAPGVSQLMVCQGSQLWWSSGGDFTDTGLTGSNSGPMRGVSFNDAAYVVRNGQESSVKWDGGSVTYLNVSGSGAWQANGAPVGGHMPLAKHSAVHYQTFWVANTVEDSVAYPNRVRWSHAGSAEDWDVNDYVDINTGQDGDYITAIVPFNDHLLVFKRFSTHAIFGYNDDSFQVVPIDLTVGAVSREAVVNTPLGVLVFHARDGVHLYAGSGFRWVFEPLYPALRDGRIAATDTGRVQLGWGANRLWVSVPWGESGERDRVFVWDPFSGEVGAWTLFGLSVGPFHEWNRPDGSSLFLAGNQVTPRVVLLEQQVSGAAEFYDDFGDGPVNIESYYRTRWMDGGQPAVKKRWKRPQFVMGESESVEPLRVDVFKDWNDVTADKTFYLTPRMTGSGMVWDQSNWDQANWAGEGSASRLARGAPMGTSQAVQLKIFGPSVDSRWGVSAVTFKYYPRPVRS